MTMAERTTEIAAPYPMWKSVKVSRNMLTARVSEEEYGPPRVMTQMMSKTLKEFTMAMVMTTVVMGASMGSFTWRKVCQALAPSMRQASMGSLGMVPRPMRNMTMLEPSCCQVHAMIMAKLLSGTSVSHDGFNGRPRMPKRPLRTPSSLLNMYAQITPVATKEMVSGMKKMLLKKPAPRTPVTKTATRRPPSAGSASVKTTQRTVFSMDRPMTRSVNMVT